MKERLIKMTFGEKLKALRKEKRYSQEKFAGLLAVPLLPECLDKALLRCLRQFHNHCHEEAPVTDIRKHLSAHK